MKRLVGWGLFFVAAIMIGFYATRLPWHHFGEERAAAKASADDLASAEREKADLLKKRSQLESESGREREARQHNLGKPGEKPL